MAHTAVSLSWESHKNNICNGLSSLQQNGEFVDMTLAADGHHVKVHQMIVALASPYIKELIRSAACPHPVIFLNKMSYTTLTAILEYIYTGEVMVSVENISELIQTARELHIKGLEDMDIQSSVSKKREDDSIAEEDGTTESIDDDICYFEVSNSRDNTPSQKSSYVLMDDGIPDDSNSVGAMEEDTQETIEIEVDAQPEEKKPRIISCIENTKNLSPKNVPNIIQYTVSNQGSLQMILNRYVYYLKHCNRNNSRQWRCVDYLNNCKCPAIVFTKDDVVVQRISAHTHPYHDKRILKKVHAGAVFTAIHEAEREGNTLKINLKKK